MLSEFNQIDVIAVTEVQSHDQKSLRLSNYSSSVLRPEFIKLRPLDHLLGKKSGGVMLFFLLNVTFSLKLILVLIYLSMMKSFG